MGVWKKSSSYPKLRKFSQGNSGFQACKNRSASKAAMHPLPAEVMAWR